MLRAALVAFVLAPLAWAESGDPPAVDPVTARRAEAAADAYTKDATGHAAAPADADTEKTLADAEKHLAECRTQLAAGASGPAGDAFVLASATLAQLKPEQRAALGKRWRSAQQEAVALGKQVLAATPAPAEDPAPAK